jgi:hypothetical protein
MSVPHCLFAAAVALLLLSPPVLAGPIEIKTTPIARFAPGEANRTRFGALEFRGGLILQSRDENFGGISGIRVEPDGEHFVAVTDRGYWLRARMITKEGRLAGLADAEMAPMLSASGRQLDRIGWADAESLAMDGNGTFFVGIERVNRVLRYDIGRDGFSTRAKNVPLPAAARALPKNQGLEALVYVAKDLPLAGTLIGLSERALDPSGNMRGFLIGGPAPGAFSIRRSNDFDITDAAITAKGELLILERYLLLLRGFGARIRSVPLDSIRPGAAIDGKVLLEAGGAHEIDNMEAMATHQNADGETLVTLASDDNFFGIQRTVLLRFALVED